MARTNRGQPSAARFSVLLSRSAVAGDYSLAGSPVLGFADLAVEVGGRLTPIKISGFENG